MAKRWVWIRTNILKFLKLAEEMGLRALNVFGVHSLRFSMKLLTKGMLWFMLIYSVIDVESSSRLTQSDLRAVGFMLYGGQPLSVEVTTAGNTIVALA